MGDQLARSWIQEGEQRRRNRRTRATLTFASFLGGTALVLLLASSATTGEVVLGTAIAIGVAVFLANRPRRERIPPYVRQLAADYGFKLSNSEFGGVTPILQQPFGRGYGVAYGTLFEDEDVECSIGPYDYVRERRWHFEMFARVALRIWGEPKAMRFVVTVVRLPQTSEFLPVLLCERRYGPEALDSVENAVRRLQRLELESSELDSAREIFVLPGQEPGWPRRVFSPAFIDWHNSRGQDVAWELVAGMLYVVTSRRSDSVDELERCFRAADEVAKRLMDEVDQTSLRRPPAISV